MWFGTSIFCVPERARKHLERNLSTTAFGSPSRKRDEKEKKKKPKIAIAKLFALNANSMIYFQIKGIFGALSRQILLGSRLVKYNTSSLL